MPVGIRFSLGVTLNCLLSWWFLQVWNTCWVISFFALWFGTDRKRSNCGKMIYFHATTWENSHNSNKKIGVPRRILRWVGVTEFEPMVSGTRTRFENFFECFCQGLIVFCSILFCFWRSLFMLFPYSMKRYVVCSVVRSTPQSCWRKAPQRDKERFSYLWTTRIVTLKAELSKSFWMIFNIFQSGSFHLFLTRFVCAGSVH